MSVGLDISNELKAYRESLKEWGREAVRPYAREADETHALPGLAATILDSAPVPLDRYDVPTDGLPPVPDGDIVRRNVWYEAVAYCDIWLSEALSRGVGHLVVDAVGTAEQKERWLRPVLEGGRITSLGLSEPDAGSDTSRIATTATREGDVWRINGSKMYCSYGAIADYVVVFASTDRERGRSAILPFIVEKDTPGLTVLRHNEDKLGLRCWTTSQLAFDDLIVPADHQLGWTGEAATSLTANGLDAALASLNHNRPNVSAQSVGLAQAALDLTADLLRDDRASFSPNRWRLVETELEQMNAALHRSRTMNLHAQALADTGVHNRLEASAAKAYGPPTSERVVRRCMQLLGPDGSSNELLLEKWYRDVKILDIFEGTGQIMRLLISRQLMGRRAAS
ncbi:acyl-CoA dehydrogenase family protein [Micromonospora olivasterospora]|uniref:Acyl-CoA dehydrogenase n=1 Tax=Micromonospora olivasterospora TaxID=1880 RepID=A0A562I2P4_MICOL|nr:acyl-CoA dehydrogenase family protein [Micromonospora olivasterospora]TWH65317.1 acyl-CoA dehydrogenase [Micromonospora olivasterospora]